MVIHFSLLLWSFGSLAARLTNSLHMISLMQRKVTVFAQHIVLPWFMWQLDLCYVGHSEDGKPGHQQVGLAGDEASHNLFAGAWAVGALLQTRPRPIARSSVHVIIESCPEVWWRWQYSEESVQVQPQLVSKWGSFSDKPDGVWVRVVGWVAGWLHRLSVVSDRAFSERSIRAIQERASAAPSLNKYVVSEWRNFTHFIIDQNDVIIAGTYHHNNFDNKIPFVSCWCPHAFVCVFHKCKNPSPITSNYTKKKDLQL